MLFPNIFSEKALFFLPPYFFSCIKNMEITTKTFYYYGGEKVADDKELSRMFEEEMNGQIVDFQVVGG